MTTAGFLREHIDVAYELGKFNDHTIQTPWSLVDEIVDQIDVMDSALVLYNPEFVWALHERGWQLDSITLFADSPSKKKWADKIGIKYITDLEGLDMKFDVCLMNPPYSENNGNKLLYPAFFERGLDMADMVISIMPENLESNWRWFIKHNRLIQQHSIKQFDVSGHFKVGIDSIHCVIASKSVNNEVVTCDKPTFDVMFPERARLNPIKGVYPTHKSKPVDGGDLPVITKIHKTGIVIENHSSDDLKTAKKNYKLAFYSGKASHLVFINHTPSRGKFNAEIVEANAQLTWSNFVFALECSSYAEAEKLKAWLTSDEICNKIVELLNGKYTVSKEIIKQLPWFE